VKLAIKWALLGRAARLALRLNERNDGGEGEQDDEEGHAEQGTWGNLHDSYSASA